MSSKRKRKSPCPFANAKKPSKRKRGSNSFDKDRADVLAASDRGSYFEPGGGGGLPYETDGDARQKF